jgi:hypothetical protein
VGLYCDLVGSATAFVKDDMGSNPFDPYPRHPRGAAVSKTGWFFNKSAGKGEEKAVAVVAQRMQKPIKSELVHI